MMSTTSDSKILIEKVILDDNGRKIEINIGLTMEKNKLLDIANSIISSLWFGEEIQPKVSLFYEDCVVS